MYDLIIIGGGPAGITAGIYAARKRLKTLIISKDLLGQAGKAPLVENYPGVEGVQGFELMERFRKNLKNFEIESKEGEVETVTKNSDGSFEVLMANKEEITAKTVIVSSGRLAKQLEAKGEKEFLGKGVSYCVTCDGPLFSGKTVAVIGGGNAAFSAALELGKSCPRVFLIEEAQLCRADEINQERAAAMGNVQVICGAEVREIRGKDFVNSLIYKDQFSGKEVELALEGIFVEIGSVPATRFIGSLVDFNERREIKINFETCETKTPGLFAAGDVTEIRYKQIIIAAGEGAKAALSAYNYLQK